MEIGRKRNSGGAAAARSPRRVAHSKSVNTQELVPAKIESDAIARLAYSYWEARGGEGGSAEEDWTRAEQALRANMAGD